SYRPEPVSFLDDKLSFRLLQGKRKVGWVGRVAADKARRMGIKQPVLIAELSLDGLMDTRDQQLKFTPLSIYPAAPRDLAIVVDEHVAAGDVTACVKKAAGELAEAVEIFDLYSGDQIQKGKKSIALSIRYRSQTGSLSNEQVEATQQRVVGDLEQKFNAEIRIKKP
ncbi:MAG: hypothetical protein OEV68_13400, partial [candidate division Zixibacteria bacterium]|nr:hypothetical protein [candidate division Zixibacteria bacterium]